MKKYGIPSQSNYDIPASRERHSCPTYNALNDPAENVFGSYMDLKEGYQVSTEDNANRLL